MPTYEIRFKGLEHGESGEPSERMEIVVAQDERAAILKLYLKYFEVESPETMLIPEEPGLGESYFAFVRRFPLVEIRDSLHLDRAKEIAHNFLRLHLDSGGEAYLNTLSILIEDYERKHGID